ncbi:Fur family transcriptional regulator [uncultured Microbacterium sp.]|uniref:Fur family transcriptional regulator n=1 Tax=uncultured Microbacterium sp. TaxID=191216 RepID=UPI0025F7794A|nr:Fur family transcriptional regulator [uncultured Microbacterium sp.]
MVDLLQTAPEPDYRRQLRDAGLRVTAPRLVTLEIVAERQHAEADEINAAARERLGDVSMQTTYGVLHALTEAGLIRRLDTSSREAARYEIHRHDNHHHLVCRICGSVEDVPCTRGEAPCLEPFDSGDFLVETADVLFRGVCAACRPPQSTSVPVVPSKEEEEER